MSNGIALNNLQAEYILENPSSNFFGVRIYPRTAAPIYNTIGRIPVNFGNTHVLSREELSIVNKKYPTITVYTHRINNRHIKSLKEYFSYFKAFTLSRNIGKYPCVIIDTRNMDRDTITFLHTMRINGRLCNKSVTKRELAIQIRSIVDIDMLNLYGVDARECTLYI